MSQHKLKRSETNSLKLIEIIAEGSNETANLFHKKQSRKYFVKTIFSASGNQKIAKRGAAETQKEVSIKNATEIKQTKQLLRKRRKLSAMIFCVCYSTSNCITTRLARNYQMQRVPVVF